MDIFDERLHPLSKDGPPPDVHNPEHRQIYRYETFSLYREIIMTSYIKPDVVFY
jgi:hypothetical protein